MGGGGGVPGGWETLVNCLELQRGQEEESKNNRKRYRKNEKEEFLKNEGENIGEVKMHIEV